jgi:hypothetical protein
MVLSIDVVSDGVMRDAEELMDITVLAFDVLFLPYMLDSGTTQ